MTNQCLKAIKDSTDHEELQALTNTPFMVYSITRKIFKIVAERATQYKFTFVFESGTSYSNTHISIRVFRKVSDDYNLIGGTTFTDMMGFFSLDLSEGEYYMCISTRQGGYTGHVIMNMAGFVPEARFSGVALTGELCLMDLHTKRPPRFCDEPLFYEILEGSLPPGIIMTGVGRLQGILPDLDCLDDSNDYSPSQNWYTINSDGIRTPWGRQWRFKVRVSIQGFEAKDEEWFCIRVHNNWDFDRDNFMRNLPFTNIVSVNVEKPSQEVLPKTLCIEPCPEYDVKEFIPIPIETECPVCDSPDFQTHIELIPLPDICCNMQAEEFPLWYVKNKGQTNCPELKEFLERLENNSYFQELLRQYGLVPGETQGVIEPSVYENFLQLSSVKMVNGRKETDIDHMMLQWRDQVNSKLPISFDAYEGFKGEMNLE